MTVLKMTVLRFSQDKGVLAKGVSAKSSVMPKGKNTRGYWAQQCIWHSEHHSQQRRTFLQKPPSRTPLFLVPEGEQVLCIVHLGTSRYYMRSHKRWSLATLLHLCETLHFRSRQQERYKDVLTAMQYTLVPSCSALVEI